jgi:hypothetical protein
MTADVVEERKLAVSLLVGLVGLEALLIADVVKSRRILELLQYYRRRY